MCPGLLCERGFTSISLPFGKLLSLTFAYFLHITDRLSSPIELLLTLIYSTMFFRISIYYLDLEFFASILLS